MRGERREVDGEDARERIGRADRQTPVERAALREVARARAVVGPSSRERVAERVGVAQAEVQPLARDRMQRLRRIADRDRAPVDERMQRVQAERKRGAPLDAA